MGFSEEWKQLPGQTKMMIVGGGGLALFFLFTALKNRNSAAQSQQQNTSAGPQQAAVDPTGWMDAQNQQVQAMQQMIGGIADTMRQNQQANQDANRQNVQAMQQLIQQNQQATQQQLQALMGNMGKTPTYSPAPAPAAPPPKPVPKSTPVPAAPHGDYYTIKKGDTLSQIALDHYHRNPYNGDINKIASANGISNPNRIYAGQKILIPK